MSDNLKLSLKLNAEIELKQLGSVLGCPVYMDLSGVTDERKFHNFLMAQKMLADFFNPPEEADTEVSDLEATDGEVRNAFNIRNIHEMSDRIAELEKGKE